MKKTIAVAIVLFAFSLPLMLTTESADASTPLAYISRGAISISGNSGFNASNGVVSGTGGAHDPFIIKGWEIGGTSGMSFAIEVLRTTAYFTVTQVHLTNSSKGVYFLNVTHGKVDHSLIDNQSVGVTLFDSDSCAIIDNNIRDCGTAVLISSSSNIRVDSNHYARNDVNVQKPSVPWEQTWLGTTVCVVVLIPFVVIVAGAIYLRFFSKGKANP
jgi:uncharacterized membrane protein